MSGSATVTVADILELRAEGLTEEEIWSLLCQAVQTLQDLFLSEKITGGEVVPLVIPSTLGISRKGAVVMSLLSRTYPHHEPYLAPEYVVRRRCLKNLDREKDWSQMTDYVMEFFCPPRLMQSLTTEEERQTSDSLERCQTAIPEARGISIFELKKKMEHHFPFPDLTMWVYSLGRTLLCALKTTAQIDSLMVLRFMTSKDPCHRATIMSLLNIISEHCRKNLPTKPSSHLVMEMYKEVFGSPPQCLLPLDTPAIDNVDAKRVSSLEASLNDSGNQRASLVNGSSGSRTAMKRNPVQRAPSRLYRGPLAGFGGDRSHRRLLPSSCVGPEFVVRGMEPLKVVHVGDVKAAQRKALTVILLTGQKLRMTCDPHVTCGKLFEALVQVEGIEDNYIFGLASAMNGDFVFVPSEMKLHKVAPPGWRDSGKDPGPSSFFLYVRVKFFLPSLWGFRNGKTKHLMYLQLRRSLLEQQIKCQVQELLTLGGLALQAEFGDFDETVHGASPYFLLEHYIPEELIDERFQLETRLYEHHKSRCGLDPTLAEEIFVGQVQGLPEYGSHHYTAVWVRKSVSIPMWVTVNPQGVYLYEKKKNVLDRKIHEAFAWKNIQGLSCNENYFRLTPHDVFGQKVTSYKLRMDNKKSFFLFRLASFHHQFFLKLRIELSPLHALSQEFGIPFKKENKSIFYLEKEREENPVEREKEGREKFESEFCQNIEERQNKENENPQENKRDKRTGVKMGVSAFHLLSSGTPEAPGRRLSFSEASADSADAFVMDSSLGSSDERFTYDLQESIPSRLVRRWEELSWEEERVLRKVRLTKDKYGSFGLEIVEGTNGGLFVENILKRRGNDEIESVGRGDQLMSVNGICLLNLNYSEALNILKSAGSEMEILVSQICKRETSRQKPLEHEYLKNIRYETANEAENEDAEIPLKTGLR